MQSTNRIGIVTPKMVLLCFTGFFIMGFSFLLRTYPGAVLEQLNQLLSLSNQQMTYLSLSYFFSYLIGLIIAGITFDFIKIKYPLLIALAVTIIGSYLFGQSSSLNMFIISRMLIGFGSAYLMIGILKLISTQLPKKYFFVFIGIVFATTSFLNAFGTLPLTNISQAAGWNTVSYYFSAIGVVLFLLFSLVTKNINYPTSISTETKSTQFKILFKNKNFWIACIIAFIVGSYTLFFSLFGIPFLTQNAGYTPSEAAIVILWFTAGSCFGLILAGFFSQLIYDRKYLIFFGFILSSIIMTSIILHTPSYHILEKLLFLFGFFAGCEVILYLIVNDVSRSGTLAAAFSIILLFGIIGSLLAQPLIGKFLGTPANWRGGLLIIPISLLIGGLLSLFLASKQWSSDKIENKLYPIQYLKAGLKGELGLGRAYWVIYVWGSFVFSFLIISLILVIMTVIPTLPSPTVVFTNPALINLLLYGLSFPYLIIAAIAVWKCSDNYRRWVGWKYIARILIIFGLINAIINIIASFIKL